jgi:ubiquinone/menaquinone biosynthesis C-methylase UbiE
LSDVLHLIPSDAGKFMKAKNRPFGIEYFERKYQYRRYADFRSTLLETVVEKLKTAPYCGNPMQQSKLLRSTAYDRAYYEQHKEAGCDYAAYGDWQREYGRWIADCMKWRGKEVLEFGCACGAIAKGLQENGCKPSGIDLNEYTVKLGREKWPEIPLYVGDGANMHMFEDQKFAGVHSQQVLEHMRPELVPFVLKELNRVCRSGATFFAVLDTANSFDRQKRANENEDPTHLCIRSMEWWASMLRLAGWEDCKESYSKELGSHVCSYLNKYDWDWFAVRKKG